jgi:5-formyltetrahydrofolate cyclo-ligase|tara:strand:- start:35448 stop:36038 length:591 start_codon:yes stop_codon:yes gene_type:complete
LLASAKIMVKNNIRKSLLEQGQLLSESFALDANTKIQQTVIKNVDLLSCKNALLYFPFKNEISLSLIIDELEKYGSNIYMPKITACNDLKFNLFKTNEVLKKNKYGIKEVKNSNFLDPEKFDIMFIPFVGVDKLGYRLGYGGGYFDRTLGKIMNEKKRPIFIGLGFDYQILNINFGESHDIKYDFVMSEMRVLSFN